MARDAATKKNKRPTTVTDDVVPDYTGTDDAPGPGTTETISSTDVKAATDVHRLVSSLVPDPASPRELSVVRGYLGPSDTKQTTRIYLDPTFSIWFEIPDEDVLHTEHLNPYGDIPFGEDVLWVTRQVRNSLVEQTPPGVGRLLAPGGANDRMGPNVPWPPPK